MRRTPNRRAPGRPYCEAFPMLDIHDVLRAAGDGRIYHQWVDEQGLKIGFASIQELNPDGLTAYFRFFGTRNVEQGAGTLSLRISYSRAGKYWQKPSFVCPKTGRSVTRVYYVRGMWGSKEFHDLISLAQRLDPVNKALYYREHYSAVPGYAPRTAAERAKAERRKLKYGNAVRDLHGETRTSLPDRLRARSIGRWLNDDELPKTEYGESEIGYGWTAGMRGQLPGLTAARGVKTAHASQMSSLPTTYTKPIVKEQRSALGPDVDPHETAPNAKGPLPAVDFALNLERVLSGLSFDFDIKIPGAFEGD